MDARTRRLPGAAFVRCARSYSDCRWRATTRGIVVPVEKPRAPYRLAPAHIAAPDDARRAPALAALDLHARLLHDTAPALDLALQVARQVFRRSRRGIQA